MEKEGKDQRDMNMEEGEGELEIKLHENKNFKSVPSISGNSFLILAS